MQEILFVASLVLLFWGYARVAIVRNNYIAAFGTETEWSSATAAKAITKALIPIYALLFIMVFDAMY